MDLEIILKYQADVVVPDFNTAIYIIKLGKDQKYISGL